MVPTSQEPALRALPSGRHDLPRKVVWASQRERLLEGMALAVAEKGYAKVVVTDIHRRAGVSRKTFYEHFTSKEECFLEAYDATVEIILGATDAAMKEAQGDPLATTAMAARAYVETLADNPVLARTFLVGVLAAGDAALDRRRAVLRRFADQIAEMYGVARARWPELPELPEYRFLAAVGAVNELVQDLLLHGEPEELRGYAEIIVDVVIAALIGHETLARLSAQTD